RPGLAWRPAGAQLVSVPQAPSSSPVIAADMPAEASSLTLREVPWGRAFELSPAQMNDRRVGRLSILERSFHPRDPENDETPPLAPGTPIRVRLWSNLPNDLEGVSFVLAHRIARPSVPEE